MAGGILETPANTQINPVEIAQQQIPLAETGLELERHQQLTPLAAKGFTLTHLIGVQAAGQLLGEGAATFQHPSSEHVGNKGTARTNRVDAGMPPEAAVLTGKQGIDQHPGIALQGFELPMLLGLGSCDCFALPVVEHQGPSHRGEAAAYRHLEAGDGLQAKAA